MVKFLLKLKLNKMTILRLKDFMKKKFIKNYTMDEREFKKI